MEVWEREIIKASRILIVDDNPDNLDILFNFLNNAGYCVLAARDGEQALRSIQLEQPALALLDIHMPGMDGYELARRIKSLPGAAKLPLIFISALHDSYNKKQALELGAADYLDKPVQNDDLQFRVANVLLLDWYRRQYQNNKTAVDAAAKDLRL
ncbi:MAG: response regulator [Spirochaetes bacterium]|nr:response regulator [Spirochaetota bacterium]MBU0955733.1 response regulator [Spirochaetota bacterium]